MYLLPGETEVRHWNARIELDDGTCLEETEPPLELFAFILAGGLFEAHNVFFERAIWRNVMVARHGWPEVPEGQWRCSAAKASMHALPRDLAGACAAMLLPVQKDTEGRKAMLRLCKPRKPKKAEAEALRQRGIDPTKELLYHRDRPSFETLFSYCAQDVRAERCLSDALGELPGQELAIWQMDQRMNVRGVMIDQDLASACLELAEQAKRRMNAELEQLTGVKRASQRQQVKDWLEEHEGLELPDTAADTLDHIIEQGGLTWRAERVLRIVKEVNRTSTRKYSSMFKFLASDGSVKDILMYHGANTGRWAGKGIQVHNFAKGELKDMDATVEDIKSRDVEWVIALYGEVMDLLSQATRGAIVPREGRDFMVADYAAIEARCVLWLSGATSALQVFTTGGDIYCDMASGIYGFEVQKKRNPNERQFGKQAVLGLGYGMGFVTFLLTCRKYKIKFTRDEVLRIMGAERLAKYEQIVREALCLAKTASDGTPIVYEKSKKLMAGRYRRQLLDAREEPSRIVHELALMKYTTDVYRSRYAEVKQMWTDQEAAAIEAVERKATREHPVTCGRVKWYLSEEKRFSLAPLGLTDVMRVPQGKFLLCELPSGRTLFYPDPEVKPVKTTWGALKKALSYMRVDPVTRKWVRKSTYGGMLVENITQAVARDVMAEAMLVADTESCYDVVMSVHDELVAEVDHGVGSEKEFERVMTTLPPWADGCPIAAEASRMRRYRK